MEKGLQVSELSTLWHVAENSSAISCKDLPLLVDVAVSAVIDLEGVAMVTYCNVISVTGIVM